MGEASTPDHIVRLLQALAAREPTESACELSPAEIFAADAGSGRLDERMGGAEIYALVVGAVPFSGSLPGGQPGADLRVASRSRRLDLVATAWSLRALKHGGRAVLLVPESMLFAATQAHRSLRRRLVEENALQAVIRLRPGCYKPRTRAAIIVVRKGGSTDSVWFYDQPPAPSRARPRGAKTGAAGAVAPPALTQATNDVIDIVSRWEARSESERDRPRTAPSFCVPRAEIAAADFDLGIDRYRVAESPAPAQARPHEILAEVAALEAEIFAGIRELVGMLR